MLSKTATLFVSLIVLINFASCGPKPAENGGPVQEEKTTEADQVEIELGNAKLPSNWPGDLPVMPGFRILEFSEGDAGDTDPSITMVGDVPVPEVAEFYSNLPGWKLDDTYPQDAPTPESVVIVLTKGDGRLVSVLSQIDPSDDDRTYVSIGILYLPEIVGD